MKTSHLCPTKSKSEQSSPKHFKQGIFNLRLQMYLSWNSARPGPSCFIKKRKWTVNVGRGHSDRGSTSQEASHCGYSASLWCTCPILLLVPLERPAHWPSPLTAGFNCVTGKWVRRSWCAHGHKGPLSPNILETILCSYDVSAPSLNTKLEQQHDFPKSQHFWHPPRTKTGCATGPQNQTTGNKQWPPWCLLFSLK